MVVMKYQKLCRKRPMQATILLMAMVVAVELDLDLIVDWSV